MLDTDRMGELLNKNDINWNTQLGGNDLLSITGTVIEKDDSDQNRNKMTIEENSELNDEQEDLD